MSKSSKQPPTCTKNSTNNHRSNLYF